MGDWDNWSTPGSLPSSFTADAIQMTVLVFLCPLVKSGLKNLYFSPVAIRRLTNHGDFGQKWVEVT